MTKRSKVELFEQIRRARRLESAVSIRELARRFGTHRRAVREALASAVPPARKPVVRSSPVLDRWKPTIDGWLEADREAPRKQRHTARRVWQRLVDEHGAAVGESTVRRYVAEVRRRQPALLVEVKVPQSHPPGAEAEVDFGKVGFWLDGVLTDGWMFVFRLSASGRGFHRIYLNQAQQAFLDGHVRAFEHVGGVPGRIRYDNLKPAVQRVLRGRDRAEAERFVALRSHYGFDSFFCQPGPEGAHEKGGVEGEVGRFRRRHLVPVPRVASMVELNELVAAGDFADDGRRIDGRAITVGEHFAAEALTLAPLPVERFDTTLLLTPRVDAKSRVCVRQCFYSVPVRYVGRRIDVRLGAETDRSPRRVTGCGDPCPAGRQGQRVAGARPLPGGAANQARRPARRHRAGPGPRLRRVQRRASTVLDPGPPPPRRPGRHSRPRRGPPRPPRPARRGDPPCPRRLRRHRCRRPRRGHRRSSPGAATSTTAVVVPIGALARYDRPPPTIAHYDQLLEAR